MNEETGVEYLTPWQVNNVIEGLGGLGVVERLPLPSKSNLSNTAVEKKIDPPIA